MIRLLAMREFRGLLAMPSTWFILAILQFIFTWFFLNALQSYLELQPQLSQLANVPGATSVIATPLFNLTALLLMMLVPMFTMRMIAEERRNQSFTLLLAAPIPISAIVIGKFLGLMAFLLLLTSTVPLMVLTLAFGTHLDLGLLLANLLGLWLLTSSYVAIGLYISSLTTHPVIAAFGTLVILTGLWLTDMSSIGEASQWHLLSPLYHFQNLNTGLLDSGDLIFFLVFSTTFLLMTSRQINNNRVYG